MPEGNPNAELSHEPSIRFHCPSSGSSEPKSDSSVAGSVAEEDLNDENDDDELEALRQVAEGSPSPTHFRLQASSGSDKEGKATEQDAHSNMTRNRQTSPHNTARSGLGDSEHNPIQLDTDIRVHGVTIDESDDEGPEVVNSSKAFEVVSPKDQAAPLPYGYILENAAAHVHPDDSTPDGGQDSDDFEVADMSDDEDPESGNEEGTDYVIGSHDKESSPTLLKHDRVCQSTYIDLEEEDEDAISSIVETEDEANVPSETELPSASDGDDRKGSISHLDTLQAKSYPAILVDHTQYQTYSVPEGSTSPILGASNSRLQLHDQALLGYPSVSERAPSPSDAAMAKTSNVKDSQLLRSPNERYTHGPKAPVALQKTYTDGTLLTNNQTVPSTDDFFRTATRDFPFVESGTSREQRTTWQGPKDRTHYNDGPFKVDTNCRPISFSYPSCASSLLRQDTISHSENRRAEASHLFYRQNRCARTYDASLDKELRSLPGDRDLFIDPYSEIPTNRLGTAMSHAIHTSICDGRNEPDSSPPTTRATTGLSIGDIIETQSTRSPASVLGSKRKADEISIEQDEVVALPFISQSSGAVFNLEDSSLPDAQPRNVSELPTQLKSTQSTDTSLGPSSYTAAASSQEGRPKKRVKTIAKWIGTTMLLGLGAVITIVSTAPQSVWDEIDREMGLA